MSACMRVPAADVVAGATSITQPNSLWAAVASLSLGVFALVTLAPVFGGWVVTLFVASDAIDRAPRGRELSVREGLTRIIVDWSGSWQAARPGNWLGRSPATKAALGC
jgi:hypothetical protein